MHNIPSVDAIYSGIKLFSKEQIFRFLAGKAAEKTGSDSDLIMDKIVSAENEIPSGVGDGVAIPHLRLNNIGAPCSMLVKLSNRIDFESVDGLPVDLVFLLISPEKDGPVHLSRLARISRLFRDRDFCRRLRKENNDNAIRSLIYEPDQAITNAA